MPDLVEANPFLNGALQAREPSAVETCQFLVASALHCADVNGCYNQALIKALSACPNSEVREVSRRLKTRFGKKLNLNHWLADIREARARANPVFPVDTGPLPQLNPKTPEIEPTPVWENARDGARVMLGWYCVYYHWVRGIVFYVGKGSSADRAYTTEGRTDAWKKVAWLTTEPYRVQIVAWFATEPAALRFELAEIARLQPEANIAGK